MHSFILPLSPFNYYSLAGGRQRSKSNWDGMVGGLVVWFYSLHGVCGGSVILELGIGTFST